MNIRFPHAWLVRLCLGKGGSVFHVVGNAVTGFLINPDQRRTSTILERDNEAPTVAVPWRSAYVELVAAIVGGLDSPRCNWQQCALKSVVEISICHPLKADAVAAPGGCWADLTRIALCVENRA
jgi:hypothetical protein